MDKAPLDIIIPIYNEGDRVLKLLSIFQDIIKTRIRVLLCYDHEDDNVFHYKDDLSKLNFNVVFVKNPSSF